MSGLAVFPLDPESPAGKRGFLVWENRLDAGRGNLRRSGYGWKVTQLRPLT